MKMKKCLSILLAIVMIATMITSLPITANAVDVDAAGTAEATVINVGTADQLTEAYTTINTNGGEYIINLTADIENGYIAISNSSAVVTVYGNGHSISRNQGYSAIVVTDGATVYLGSEDGGDKNILTIVGSTDNDDPGIVFVKTGSTCHMYDKVTLKDHKGNNYIGGGVTVEGGTFIMNGGTIENCGIDGGSNCYGGGVGVYNGGYFEMNGGTIKDCYVISKGNSWQIPWVAGGGVFVLRASFTMNGGTIENCSATNYETSENFDALGGGVAAITSLDGVYDYNQYGYLDSNVTMNGGTIKDCSSDIGGGALAAGLWYINNKAVATYQGYVDPTDNPGIFLNGGTMSGNDSSMGGAMFFCQVRPSVSIKNMTIDSNSAEEGGAIDVFDRWTHAQIENCTITNNASTSKGGAIMLDSNTNSSGTHIKDTTITGNISGDRGAGIYYDANSTLTISGANNIQNNTYNDALNNLNVLSLAKPVYVDGDLTGSQIGLSDPTLWDDSKTDDDATAVSTDYLTSGYKAYNTANPSNFFTSDHETWVADYSDVNPNEVRLVRKETVDYHINNQTIADAKYEGKDIFTDVITAAGTEINVGEKITSFYTVPEVVPTAQNSCPYIFKGWYYDKANDDDSHPVVFDTDTYTAGRDIYAHWIKVDNVAQDSADEYSLPNGNTYGGFDLAGVQIREGVIDTNFDSVKKPGGMRFITSLSKKVVNEINQLKKGGNNIEYGYVTASDTNEDWIKYHDHYQRKLQYVSESANGIDTCSQDAPNETYFGFAKNVNCTSKESNKNNGIVALDHRSYGNYLLYTLVITYEGATAADKAKNILARPYIHYNDANGLERVAYSDYNGKSNKLGGCYTNYDSVVKISL